jgi:hypothetical protein
MATTLLRVLSWILWIVQPIRDYHFLPLLSKAGVINLIDCLKKAYHSSVYSQSARIFDSLYCKEKYFFLPLSQTAANQPGSLFIILV